MHHGSHDQGDVHWGVCLHLDTGESASGSTSKGGGCIGGGEVGQNRILQDTFSTE